MKKKGTDTQKTDELVRKLQASLLGNKRQDRKPEQDADDAEFQAKIAGMLQNMSKEAAAEDRKPQAEQPKKKAKAKPAKAKPEPTATATTAKSAAQPTPQPQPEQQPEQEPTPAPVSELAPPPKKTEKHVPEALRRLTEDNPNAPEPERTPPPKPEPAKVPEKKPDPKPEPVKVPEKRPDPKPEPVKVPEKKPDPKPEPVKVPEKKPDPKSEPVKVPEKKPDPKPEPAKVPEKKPEPKPEPIVIVPIKPEQKPAQPAPNPVQPSREPIRIAPPTSPPEQEEAVQEKKEQTPRETKAPTAKQETEKTIVINTPAAKGERAGDPIVIKPRASASRQTVEAAEEKPEPSVPITVTPPKDPKPAQKPEEKSEARHETKKISSGVSLPRSHQPERPWEKPQTAKAPAPAAQKAAEPAQNPAEPAAKPASADEKAASKPTAAVRKPAAAAQKNNGFRLPGKRPKKINRTPIASLPEDGDLDEALDDTVENAVPELLPMDAPEPEDLSGDAALKKTSIFARRREKKKQEVLDSGDALELIRKKTGMSEDDIAMIFELGYDNELGRLVGYETLKKLRYEHRQKTREAEHRRFRTAFGYRGEDGADGDFRQSTLAAYAHDRKNLILRVVLTAFCALLLAFLDIPGLTGGVLDAYRTAYPWLFPAVSLFLLIGAAALSYRQIEAGLHSLFRFTPTPYSAVAILTPIALLYGAAVLISGGAADMQPIGFGTVCALLLTALCDTLRLANEMRCFRLAAAEGPKTVLDATEPRKKKLRHGERIVRIINDEIDQNLYRVRKSERITGFFHRCNDFSSAALPFSILLGVMLGASILCGLIGAVRADSFTAGLSAFAVTLMYTAPTSAVFLYFYPLCRVNRGLSYRNAALIGEGSVTEYSQPKTVIFNDSDLYAAQKCTQISVRDGEDFRQDMKLAGILFRKMSGTLDAAGMNAGSGKADEDLPVVFLRMTDGGTEALIDNKYHLLAGNAVFLGKSGVRIPRESTDRSARRAGNVSLMYVAIDGVLKLSYEIEYSTAPDFETMAGILAEADTVTAIQTYDPNLNEAFLRSSRGEGAPYVRVMKPGRYEQDSLQSVVDSGVLTLGKTTDIARPVCAASAIVRLRRVGCRVLCAGAALGAALGVVLGFHTAELQASALVLLPTLFRLFWDLVAWIATRILLPSGKRE